MVQAKKLLLQILTAPLNDNPAEYLGRGRQQGQGPGHGHHGRRGPRRRQPRLLRQEAGEHVAEADGAGTRESEQNRGITYSARAQDGP